MLISLPATVAIRKTPKRTYAHSIVRYTTIKPLYCYLRRRWATGSNYHETTSENYCP